MPATVEIARPLLDFLGAVETGRAGTEAYRTIYGHREKTLAKPVTDMTMDELLAAQLKWGKNWGSSAAGKYQIIRATLKGLVAKHSVPGDKKFTPTMQDQFGLSLLRQRGLDKYLAGEMTLEAFALELAKEWASMPVLSRTKGQKRTVEAGQSYYAGDGLNKSLVEPAALVKVLKSLKAAEKPRETLAPIPATTVGEQTETPASAPNPPTRGGINWWYVAIGIIAVLMVGAAVFFRF